MKGVRSLALITSMFSVLAVAQEQRSEALRSYAETQARDLRGTLGVKHLVGPLTGEAMNYVVYLPDGYTSSSARYSTIYHLHGALRGSWEDERPMLLLEANHIAAAMESAADLGLVEPSIIVVPHDPFGRSMWADSKDGTQPVETMLVQELIPHTDREYRTVPEGSARVIQGFSMGGFGAVKTAAKYPGLFDVVINYDGALHDWASFTTERAPLAERVFANDPSHFDDFSPWTHMRDARRELRRNVAFKSNIGSIIEYNRRLRDHMRQMDIPLEHTETPCGHNIFCIIEETGQQTFAFIGRHLAQE